MITSVTIFKNQSSLGWGLHFMREDTETIDIEELPVELAEVARVLIKYCCGYQTPAETAATQALELLADELTDEKRLELKDMHPTWNPYADYKPGDIVKYKDHLCRFNRPVRALAVRAEIGAASSGTIIPNKPPDKDSYWDLIGEQVEILDWTPQGEYDEGYKEGDRVRFDDGVVRISKINNNRYRPDIMPEVWAEV
ncbi:MAG: hypothetical protein Q4E09_05955 [Eubacteriales bacterium]|nr:hypothetical protein [Eubacteriales bacterium]